MPIQTINGARLFYSDTGGDHEMIVFAHGLGWSSRMYSAQIESLKKSYRCVAFDFRGQGMSETTADGYDIDELTDDTIEFITWISPKPVHFVGLSMGGFVGMRLAARHPDLIKSLTLLNTSGDSEPFAKRLKYQLMALAVKFIGLKVVLSATMRVMFGKSFLNDEARKHEIEHWRNELLSNCRTGIVRAIHGVIRRSSILPEINQIKAPTLVIAGEEDTATPPRCGKQICQSIPGASIASIAACGHSSTIEAPEQVNTAMLQFLESVNHSTSYQPTTRTTP